MANIRAKDLPNQITSFGDSDWIAADHNASGETRKVNKAAIKTGLGLATARKTVVSTTNPTPDYVGQPGLDASGKTYVAIALTGTMWEEVAGIDNNHFSKSNGVISLKDKPKGSYFDTLVWIHSRDEAEYIGSNYSNYLGVGIETGTGLGGIIFNQVHLPFYILQDGKSQSYYINVYVKHFGTWQNDRAINNLTLIESLTIEGINFNADPDGFQVIRLSNKYTLSTNDTFVILALPVSGSVNIGIRNWALDGSSSPSRFGVFYTNDPNGLDAGKTWTAGFKCVPPIFSLEGVLPSELKKISGLNRNLGNLIYSKFDKPSVRFAIPSNIYIAVSRELNIWNDALILAYGNNMNVNYTCNVGYSKERGFRYTPSGTRSDTLTIKAMDQNNNVLDQKIITINSVAKNNGSGTKQILVIGDSLIVASNGSTTNIPVTELRTLINNDGGFTPLFLGTQGSSPNLHEGYGGYSYSNFIGTSSPFYDGTRINFKNWMSVHSNFGGTDTIDFVIVQLGVNDVSSLLSNPLYTKVSGVETIITNIKTLVDKILDATYGYPSAKIILNLPPISGNTKDGFAAIGSGDTKQNRELLIRMLWERMVEEFDESAYSAQVRLGISGLMIDRTYGYQRVLSNVSSRESTQIYEHNNSVHPYDSGYKQMSDAFYSAIRGLL